MKEKWKHQIRFSSILFYWSIFGNWILDKMLNAWFGTTLLTQHAATAPIWNFNLSTKWTTIDGIVVRRPSPSFRKSSTMPKQNDRLITYNQFVCDENKIKLHRFKYVCNFSVRSPVWFLSIRTTYYIFVLYIEYIRWFVCVRLKRPACNDWLCDLTAV